jgi:hypothetical protein
MLYHAFLPVGTYHACPHMQRAVGATSLTIWPRAPRTEVLEQRARLLAALAKLRVAVVLYGLPARAHHVQHLVHTARAGRRQGQRQVVALCRQTPGVPSSYHVPKEQASPTGSSQSATHTMACLHKRVARSLAHTHAYARAHMCVSATTCGAHRGTAQAARPWPLVQSPVWDACLGAQVQLRARRQVKAGCHSVCKFWVGLPCAVVVQLVDAPGMVAAIHGGRCVGDALCIDQGRSSRAPTATQQSCDAPNEGQIHRRLNHRCVVLTSGCGLAACPSCAAHAPPCAPQPRGMCTSRRLLVLDATASKRSSPAKLHVVCRAWLQHHPQHLLPCGLAQSVIALSVHDALGEGQPLVVGEGCPLGRP